MDKKRQFRLKAALTAALLAVVMAGCSSPQTGTETKTDMRSKHNADTKASGAVEILSGHLDVVGGCKVRVMNMYNDPIKNVWLGVSASVDQAGYSMRVAEHELIPFGDGLHRILSILPGTETQRGRVRIASVPSQLLPSSPGRVAVYIIGNGWLRVNGTEPDIRGSSDIEVAAWNTGQSPASVDVLWYPAQYALKDTNPKNIQRAHLEVGSSLNIGDQVLTVRAIEPQATDHPAWVRFEMAGSGSR